MNDEEILYESDMDIVGSLFGIRIVPRDDTKDDLIYLYVEDDENYIFKMAFSAFWLNDLKNVCDMASKKASCSYE